MMRKLLFAVSVISVFALAGCNDDEMDDINSEGSIANPVEVIFEIAHNGSVNGGSDQDRSYYKFTLNQLIDVVIIVRAKSKAQQLAINFYGTDSAFTTLVDGVTDADTFTSDLYLTLPSLAADTYFFEVYDLDFDAITYTISVINAADI